MRREAGGPRPARRAIARARRPPGSAWVLASPLTTSTRRWAAAPSASSCAAAASAACCRRHGRPVARVRRPSLRRGSCRPCREREAGAAPTGVAWSRSAAVVMMIMRPLTRPARLVVRRPCQWRQQHGTAACAASSVRRAPGYSATSRCAPCPGCLHVARLCLWPAEQWAVLRRTRLVRLGLVSCSIETKGGGFLSDTGVVSRVRGNVRRLLAAVGATSSRLHAPVRRR